MRVANQSAAEWYVNKATPSTIMICIGRRFFVCELSFMASPNGPVMGVEREIEERPGRHRLSLGGENYSGTAQGVSRREGKWCPPRSLDQMRDLGERRWASEVTRLVAGLVWG
ncbi:hypothetical protein GCM10010471_08370 [Leucobacter komagatae]